MSESRGLIVDRTYRVEEGKPQVYLFGRLENGESFMTVNDCLPYFYIKAEDRESAEQLVKFVALETTDLKTFKDELVLKAVVAEPNLVPDVRKILEAKKIACYEADIRFTQRFLMDRNIFSTLSIAGEHAPSETVDRVYQNPELGPAETTVPLRILSIDLEASGPDEGLLFCVGLAGKAFGGDGPELKEVLLLSNSDVHGAEAQQKAKELAHVTIVETERALLELLTRRILAYDPDIITGWNVIDFDLEFLRAKYEKHALPFAWGRNGWQNKLRIESLFSRDSKAEIPGRMVLDGIHLLKSSFIALDDYKLETAARELLGEHKLIGGKNKVEEINDAFTNDPEKLVAYNLHDCELVLKILESKRLIELTVLRSKLVGLGLDRVRASIASLDSVYLRELHARGFVAPSGAYVEKEEGITGGYVRQSAPGIYEWVIVLDFKSLYPSVMRTFNIDPLDHRPTCTPQRPGERMLKAPNGTCFVDGNGILPGLLQRFWEERDRAKKRKDAVGSQAFKILMNSFFGVMASPNCRFFSMELANAITYHARAVIQKTIERLEHEGFTAIYGDTDSVFLRLNVQTIDEAERVGAKIAKEINAYYREFVQKEYGRTSYLEIQFDKIFRKFLMPRVRGSETGAKKRYAGLLVTRTPDGKTTERMDFTGLEFVRRDWTELAKRFQLGLLERIFNEEEVEEWAKQFVKDVRAGKHDDLLVYRKAVRKDLEGYTKTTPQHVKAARALVKREGALSSRIIEYVVTKNGPEPIGHMTGPLDYDHYLEKQVRPIADAILCFFNLTFDDLVNGSTQKTLFGF